MTGSRREPLVEIGGFAPLAGAEGVWLHRPRRFQDDRGISGPVMVDDDWRRLGWRGFVQENQSHTPLPGVVRGLHLQAGEHAQGKIVRVVRGAAYSVGLDLRPGSPTFRRHAGAVLSDADDLIMFVPAGYAHGLQILEPNTVVCWMTDRPFAPEARGGVLWNDPEAGVDWPIREGVAVSEADARLPGLAAVAPGLDV